MDENLVETPFELDIYRFSDNDDDQEDVEDYNIWYII